MKKYQRKIINNLSGKHYHEETEHISSSIVIKFLRSPLHFLYHKELKEEIDSENLELGKAIHLKILEGDRIYKDKVKILEKGTRKPTGKSLKTLAPNFEIVLKNEMKTNSGTYSAKEYIDTVARQIKANKFLNDIISRNSKEISFFNIVHGVKCKAKPDILVTENEKDFYIGDFKSTVDATYRGFQNQARRLDYFFKIIFHATVVESFNLNLKGVFFIAAEKEPPFLLNYFPVDEATIEYEKERVSKTLELIKKAAKEKKYNGYKMGEEISGWMNHF